MSATWFPKPYADAVQRLRVPSGFLLIAGFAWLAEPTVGSLVSGVPVSAAGLWLRGWAAGHLAKNETLAQSGPYGYLRNPLYVGTLLMALGLVVSASRWELAVLAAAVFGLVYLPVIELEEQHLRALFPSYREYAKRVPMLWPGGSGASSGGFRWSLYMRNQEYKALVAYAVALAWLVWMALRRL